MSEGRVRLQVVGSVAELLIDRPAKRNALAGTMRERLRDAIVEAAQDDRVRALVVSGSGAAFCAGGDVPAMARMHEGRDERALHRVLHAGAECVLALQAFPGLTIAAVDGVAAGAGFALALNCDVRLASPRASFVASWTGVGLVPDWGASYWLPRMLGYARALELICSRRMVQAEEALRLGLVARIVPEEELLASARALALEWGGPRTAVQRARALLRRAGVASLEAALAMETETQEELFQGAEVGEGLRAFLERRPPRFYGEDDS